MDNKDIRLYLSDEELAGFPDWLLAEFNRVAPLAEETLPTGDFRAWAEQGIRLARQANRPWEAVRGYFKATPYALRALQFPHFLSWASWGEQLCRESPAVSAAYFGASPQALGSLAPYEIGVWAKLGLQLYKGSWRSGLLASAFFDVSPGLLACLSMEEMEQLVLFLDSLAGHSYDLASECLNLACDVLPGMERRDRRRFLLLAPVLAQTNLSDAKEYLSSGPKVLARIKRDERSRFLYQVEMVARSQSQHMLSFWLDASRSLSETPDNLHPQLLSLSARLMVASPLGALEFLRSCPSILARTKASNLERWFEDGMALLKNSEPAGIAYFRLESARSRQALERLSSGVELDRVKEILRMYCTALSARDVQVLPTQDLTAKGIGWISPDKASTEGSSVYLTPFVEKYATREENFSWYKVVVTHQSVHLEFGSFDFSFEREANLFPNLRQELSAEGNGATVDMERFFDLFEDRQLAVDLFTVVEDSRVDFRVKSGYRGIRQTYGRTQQEALATRPPLESLPLRKSMVESLVRISLDQMGGFRAPSQWHSALRKGASILNKVRSPHASVEDSAEATIRLYFILNAIPNINIPLDSWETLDLGELGDEVEEPMEALAGQQGSEAPDVSALDQDSLVPYSSPEGIEFRGEFKPELVQLLNKLRLTKDQKSPNDGTPLSKEALKQLVDKSVEVEIDQLQSGELQDSSGMFVDNLLKEASVPQDEPHDPVWEKPKPSPSSLLKGESLETDEPFSVLYDEWDFRANDYKPKWCRVRQKTLEEGDTEFFDNTLKEHFGLASQIKKQFELITPEVFRKIKMLPDGEDFDLDTLIEAVAEKKAGGSPSEKIYWMRNKAQRDVAVVFLLDMSASTAEAIEEERKRADDQDCPTDPQQYLAWFRAQRQDGFSRKYKRIVDVEKESTVLLIKALETIGDAYGIYGFSGYGRENVEFFVIKDIDEPFSDRVKKRIDKIAPVHATRMGAAIRHAISKLENRHSKTKILFLISDGRPQDHGYSRDGVEKEHAIHDTKMALLEAKRKFITPFCLTVDKAGHDYLKTMCHDVAYEVVSDIQSLPKRLPALYRKLTI